VDEKVSRNLHGRHTESAGKKLANAARAVNAQFVGSFSRLARLVASRHVFAHTAQTRHQTRQTKQMIAVQMRHQQAPNLALPNRLRAHQLMLSPLSNVKNHRLKTKEKKKKKKKIFLLPTSPSNLKTDEVTFLRKVGTADEVPKKVN
jgi:hypothetical protein